MEKLKSTVVRKIDPFIWREFKAICVKKDVSINQKIKDLIRAYIEQNRK